MNAKQARNLASKINVGSGSQYSQIIKLIKEAVSKGEYSIFIYASVDEDSRKKLKKDGYNVGQTASDRNELITKINW